jgi:hypothetical protein
MYRTMVIPATAREGFEALAASGKVVVQFYLPDTERRRKYMWTSWPIIEQLDPVSPAHSAALPDWEKQLDRLREGKVFFVPESYSKEHGSSASPSEVLSGEGGDVGADSAVQHSPIKSLIDVAGVPSDVQPKPNTAAGSTASRKRAQRRRRQAAAAANDNSDAGAVAVVVACA